MSGGHIASEKDRYTRRQPGERLLAVGVVVFGIGLLASLVTVVPLFMGTDPLPLPFYLISCLTPVGFALALSGVVLGSRARRRPRRVIALPAPSSSETQTSTAHERS